MKCFDENVIKAFLESELGEAESERVLEHLAECERCAEIFASFADSERVLVDSLAGHGAREAMEMKKGPCLDKKLILGYVINALQKDGVDFVEGHLKDCGRCFSLMLEIQQRNLKEADLGVDFVPVSPPQDNLVVSLVEDLAKKIYEVVESTGRVLVGSFPVEAEAVRGRAKRQGKDRPILIQKAFVEKGFSVEMEITKGESPHTCDIGLSLMNMRGDEITGVSGKTKVSLSGEGYSKDTETDKKGKVKVAGLPPGSYKITFDCGLEVFFNIGKKD